MRYLIHYGIKGQQWGVKNGPPYPLDQKTHRKVVDKVKEHTRNLGRSIDTKRLMKQAAIAAGVGLAVIGGYALYESGALDDFVKTGKNFVGNVDLNKEIPRIKSSDVENTAAKTGDFASRLKTRIADPTKAGIHFSKVDSKMLESINGRNKDKKDNCPSTTISYILNRLFGGNFTALTKTELGEKTTGDIRSLFKSGTINRIDASDIDPNCPIMGVKFDQRSIDKIPNGSTGIIAFRSSKGAGHVANYEKDINGVFAIIEPQKNRIFEKLTALLHVDPTNNGYEYVQEIMDFSNAELADDAISKLPGWVR